MAVLGDLRGQTDTCSRSPCSDFVQTMPLRTVGRIATAHYATVLRVDYISILSGTIPDRQNVDS